MGIYIHIPFCFSRCIYCDFFSSTQSEWKDAYVDALCREIIARSPSSGQPSSVVRTIYVGGGTPSQLTTGQLERIFQTVYTYYNIEEHAEVTLEVNPNDATDSFIDAIRNLPVNRLSFGIQSFDDQQLRFLRRRHTAVEAIDAVRRSQDAGFCNISIDLIFGIPVPADSQLAIQTFSSSLQKAVSLGIQHLSAYSLMYEEGTPLTRMRDRGEIQELDEETSLSMFELLMDRTHEAGFQHYEISNFCLPQRQSRHNAAYWDGTPYLGFGAGAHSFDGQTRSWNIDSVSAYIRGEQGGSEILTIDNRFDERIMTGLRTAKGVDMQRLRRDFGNERWQKCMDSARRHLDSGMLQLDERTQQLHLTRAGIFVSDDIMSDLMCV